MIRALIDGELFRASEQRIGKAGKPFATAKMTAKQADGESVFVSLICFDADLVERLAGLNAGMALAVAGRVSLTTYTGKDGTAKAGMDVVAEELAALAKPSRKPKCRNTAPAGDPFAELPGVGDLDLGSLGDLGDFHVSLD